MNMKLRSLLPLGAMLAGAALAMALIAAVAGGLDAGESRGTPQRASAAAPSR